MIPSDQDSGQPDRAPPTAPPPAPDLPSHARCEGCGYSLRGLTEPKCPECGTPFDPSRLVKMFIAKWPRLLLLILAADLLIELSGAWKPFKTFVVLPPENIIPRVIFRMGLIFTLSLGGIAFYGLYLRRDWGRRTVVILMVLTSLFGLNHLREGYFALRSETAGTPNAPTPNRNLGERPDLVRIWLARGGGNHVIEMVLKPWALLAFLLTGMRVHSLARGGRRYPPPISAARYGPRNDWLLLLILVLLVMAAGHLLRIGLIWPSFVRSWNHVAASTPWFTRFTYHIHYYLLFLTCAWCILCTVWMWNRPRAVRFVCASLFVLIAFQASVPIFSALTRTNQISVWDALGSLQSQVRGMVQTMAAPLALMTFALFVLRADDLARPLAAAGTGPPKVDPSQPEPPPQDASQGVKKRWKDWAKARNPERD